MRKFILATFVVALMGCRDESLIKVTPLTGKFFSQAGGVPSSVPVPSVAGGDSTHPLPIPTPTPTAAPQPVPIPSQAPSQAPSSVPSPVPLPLPTPAQAPGAPATIVGGWQLTFDDEFNDSALDLTKWESTLAGSRTLAGNRELECYLDGNVQFLNGSLQLIARQESVNCPSLGNFGYTSGAVSTFGFFSQAYGYFEISTNLPKGQGLSPAIWMLAADGTWPLEIDILQVLNNSTDVANQTLQWKKADGSHGKLRNSPTVSDLATGFHKIGLDWEPGSVTWYVDGVLTSQQTGSTVPDKAMYLLINLAVGGNAPGSPDGSTPFPSTMSIDYVRAYQKVNNGQPNDLPPGY